MSSQRSQRRPTTRWQCGHLRKGFHPAMCSPSRRTWRVISGWVRPTGLLRFDGNRFSPWQPRRSSVGAPEWSGSRDRRIATTAASGSASVVAVASFGFNAAQIVKYAAADGAPPGVSAMTQDRQGAIWVADSSRAVQVRQQSLDAGRKESRATTAPRPSVCTRIAPAISGSGRRPASTRRRRTSFELVDAAATNVQSLTEDASGATSG